MNVLDFNREAWNKRVGEGNRWTVPMSAETIAAARRGDWQLILTPKKPVPREWFGDVAGRDVLCLASGGGQQAPVLSAAGARVTLLDNSPAQLDQDRMVAQRDQLDIAIFQGDMADLSRFADGSFDLIFHPVSNCFVPQVRPVWREAFRVLRPGGALLAGFTNPILYVFDDAACEKGEFVVRHKIPYSDLTSLSDEERRQLAERQEPLNFGHTLEDQIGGQLDAGFVMAGFYEDGDPAYPLARFLPVFIATRSVKPIG